LRISVIVPARNEQENLEQLTALLIETLPPKSEIVIVNNGSTDGSSELLQRLKEEYPIVVVEIRPVVGRTYAIKKGIEASTGDLIAMIDADLQYHPKDLLKLHSKLIEEGLDFVTGWRDYSKYPFGNRVISKIYNWIFRRFFHAGVHDANCGLKLFKREVANDLIYRRGYSRYFVGIASDMGYKVGEVKVDLYERSAGKSNYSKTRIFGSFFDLISVKLSLTIFRQPMHFFGALSFVLITGGVLYNLFNKTFYPTIMIVSGFVSVLFGLIAEMIMNLEPRWRLERQAAEKKVERKGTNKDQ